MFMCCPDGAQIFPHTLLESREHSRGITQPNTPTECSGRAHHDHPHLCIAHGCDAMLEKAYDKKCRTCQFHRQANTVDFNGMPHRFCQKCSRFHAIEEFDGVKRNCRQRLYEHNNRQRRLRMLRKAAQQAPATPTYTPVCENTAYFGANTSLQAPSTPAFVPQCPVPDIVSDLDFDGADTDPLSLLDTFDIDQILNSDLLIAEFNNSQNLVENAGELPSITVPAVLPAPPLPAPVPACMSYQPQATSNAIISANPIELDEFLWLEQSLAAPWAPIYSYNNFGGAPVL